MTDRTPAPFLPLGQLLADAIDRGAWRAVAAVAAWVAVIVAALALLAGCAATPPAQVVHVPQVVRVPVPVPCIARADLPEAPTLAADAELARLDDYSAVLSIERQRRLLREYRLRAEPLLAACSGPITQPVGEADKETVQ